MNGPFAAFSASPSGEKMCEVPRQKNNLLNSMGYVFIGPSRHMRHSGSRASPVTISKHARIQIGNNGGERSAFAYIRIG
jgi:hypothetical protein